MSYNLGLVGGIETAFLPTAYGTYQIPLTAITRIWGSKVLRINVTVPVSGRMIPLGEGTVFIWNDREERYKIYRGGVDPAIRGCYAIKSNYGIDDAGATEAEQAVMDRMIAENMAMCYQLLDWKGMNPRDRKQRELDIVALAGSLGPVRDQDKRLAQLMMLQARTVVSSAGFVNIGRTRALQSGAAYRGIRRAEAMRAISGHVDRRKVALFGERANNLSIRRRVLAKLDRLDSMIASAACTAFEKVAQECIVDLNSTHDKPWRRSFKHTAYDLNQAIEDCQHGNRRSARRLLFFSRTSLDGLDDYGWISEWQMPFSKATERRPRVDEEIEFLWGRLKTKRASLDDMSQPKNRTTVCERTRIGLDTAFAMKEGGAKFPAIREQLRLAVDHY